MKSILLSTLLALFLFSNLNTALAQDYGNEGLVEGSFSVGEGRTVVFSKGNLQYQASSKTWRFAQNQYDVLDEENERISATNRGWIDLFGWGTSGWNSGADAYQPYSAAQEGELYNPGEKRTNSLVGDYEKADLGVFNAISNGGNREGMWRTLTHDEWTYLFEGRKDASQKWAAAKVGKVPGLVVLPDNWIQPAGVSFVFGNGAGYKSNTYTLSEWQKMQAGGAVFLPTAGERMGSLVFGTFMRGCYWTSTYGCENSGAGEAYIFMFDQVEAMPNSAISPRSNGQSVRLVLDKDVK